jgi:hypothetical protein
MLSALIELDSEAVILRSSIRTGRTPKVSARMPATRSLWLSDCEAAPSWLRGVTGVA